MADRGKQGGTRLAAGAPDLARGFDAEGTALPVGRFWGMVSIARRSAAQPGNLYAELCTRRATAATHRDSAGGHRPIWRDGFACCHLSGACSAGTARLLWGSTPC